MVFCRSFAIARCVILTLKMEDQSINSQLQQPPVNPVPVSKKPNHWLIAVTILVFIFIVGGVYALVLQSQKRISSAPKPTISPSPISPTPNPDPTANWKTYIIPDNAFSFKYPSGWEYEVTDSVFTIKGKEYSTTYIKFGRPFTEKERKEFGYIDINDAPKIYFSFSLQYASHTDFTDLTVDNLVEELINKRFSIVDNPTILLLNNNIQAREVGYACQEGCADILFKNNTTIFDFSTSSGGNLTPLTQRQILSTFKFTNREEQVVCTLDAKLCPDGSYVSRQAPNCEFAKCP